MGKAFAVGLVNVALLTLILLWGARTGMVKRYRILTVTDPENRLTRLTWQKDGKLRQVFFSDGATRLFRYHRLGLRERVDFEDGAGIDYRFNDIGSLMEIEVRDKDGGVTGQTLILDEEQKTIESRTLGAEPIGYRYDNRGNLLQAMQGESSVSFGYDGLGRLTEVAAADGSRAAYRYAEQEPDLRRRLDRTTRLNVSGRARGGQTFDSALQLFRNRTVTSDFGAVRFDEEPMDFRLSPQEQAVSLPEKLKGRRADALPHQRGGERAHESEPVGEEMQWPAQRKPFAQGAGPRLPSSD